MKPFLAQFDDDQDRDAANSWVQDIFSMGLNARNDFKQIFFVTQFSVKVLGRSYAFKRYQNANSQMKRYTKYVGDFDRSSIIGIVAGCSDVSVQGH